MLVIFVDALNYTTFLKLLYKHSILGKQDEIAINTTLLRTYPAYSPGLHTSIWLSQPPSKHLVVMEYEFRRKSEDYSTKHYKEFNELSWCISAVLDYFLGKLRKKTIVNTHYYRPAIPRPLRRHLFKIPISDIDIKTYKLWSSMLRAIGFNITTLFDVLDRENINYLYIFDKNGFLLRENTTFNFSLYNKYKVIILYLALLDALGHKYGPNSTYYLYYTQKLIKRIFEWLNYFDIIMVFTDHGMAENKGSLNSLPLIKFLHKHQALYFIDGTIIRILDTNGNISKNTLQSLFANGKVTILSKKELLTYGLPPIYDYVIISNEGYEFRPNFYNPPFSLLRVKGLHGFTPDNMSMRAFITLIHKGVIHKVSSTGTLCDVAPTILKMFNISPPSSWSGKALII